MQNPPPIFDALEQLDFLSKPNCLKEIKDFSFALDFLKAYRGSQGTFNSYRREIERLLLWSSLIAKKPLKELNRQDIEAFLEFCQNPPKEWVGIKKAPHFINKEGLRIANPEWRPFVVTVAKSAFRKGKKPEIKNFARSQGAVKETFAILSSFYNYLLQEEYVFANPVALIRQKSQFIRRQQSMPKVRRLSEMQWHYVIENTKKMAEENPIMQERTLFIITALYAMYLRISELTASARWLPKMSDFNRDSEGSWWFNTVGKGNKQRQIAVSDAMLEALKRYRKFLGLSQLPSPADNSPLLPKEKGKGAISSTTYVREIVQSCFDSAIEKLKKDGQEEEAETLNEATVHWLRHTGISDDVKHRPREHVRDDAGHSSSATTDRYIDIELRARHASAKKKSL
ncbi:MAG: integrase [Gammaproteobacteria bacterium GWE2_37_16]|nr:MAG: integrase [Gammaproteobacteria bacterium GWE2_37_16]